MWCKVFDVIGSPDNLVYLSLDIPDSEYSEIPGFAGIGLLNAEERQRMSREDCMALMIKRAIELAKKRRPNDEILLLADGPYGIPIVEGQDEGSYFRAS